MVESFLVGPFWETNCTLCGNVHASTAVSILEVRRAPTGRPAEPFWLSIADESAVAKGHGIPLSRDLYKSGACQTRR